MMRLSGQKGQRYLPKKCIAPRRNVHPQSAIRGIGERMREISSYTSAVAASVEQQNAATSEISHNVTSAAQGTVMAVSVLGEVAGAAAATRSSAQTVLDASKSVESAVAKLRGEVETFLDKVAV